MDDPIESETAKANDHAASQVAAAILQRQKDKFGSAVAAVRACCGITDLPAPEQRSRLAARLTALACLCREHDFADRLAKIPRTPGGVDCGIVIFEAALADDAARVLRLLEQSAAFVEPTQRVMTDFLRDVGWLLWNGATELPKDKNRMDVDSLMKEGMTRWRDMAGLPESNGYELPPDPMDFLEAEWELEADGGQLPAGDGEMSSAPAVAKRPGAKPKRDDAQFRKVIDLHQRGNGPKAIVEETGYTLKVVNRYLSRHRKREARNRAADN